MTSSPPLSARLRQREGLWELAERSTRRFAVATSGLRVWPHYLLIGTKRGGTTTLAYALLEHRQVVPMFPSATILPLDEHRKGVHYFDTALANGERWYRSHFATSAYLRARQRLMGVPLVTGEASPYYLYRPGASAQAKALLPQAKILVLLRDPVDRAFSHYKEQRRRGQEPLNTFEEAIDAEPRRLIGEAERLRADPMAVSFAHENQSYVSQGEYAPALSEWLDAFGDQVFVRFSDDFYADGPTIYDEICRFIGIEPRTPPTLRRRNPSSDDRVDPALRQQLREHYAEADEQLEKLLGTVPAWRR
jgi:hypothetical protein